MPKNKVNPVVVGGGAAASSSSSSFPVPAADERSAGCEFYCLVADMLRTWRPSAEEPTLPRLQVLMRRPGWVVKVRFSLEDAYSLDGKPTRMAKEVLAVSHRWENAAKPDVSGEQITTIRTFVQGKHTIKYIWYDFWCMWQPDPDTLEPDPKTGKDRARDDRTDEEKEEFGVMLKNVNTLYLGCHVLILVDGSSMSRFWPILETWLAMQELTPSGLKPSSSSDRYTIQFILTAVTQGLKEGNIEGMLKYKSPEEMFQMLDKPDIAVTNQKDKLVQLAKVKKINASVVMVFEVLMREIETAKRHAALAAQREKDAELKQQAEAKARIDAQHEAARRAEFEAQIRKLSEAIEKLEADESAAAAKKEYARAGEAKEKIDELSGERAKLQADEDARRLNRAGSAATAASSRPGPSS